MLPRDNGTDNGTLWKHNSLRYYAARIACGNIKTKRVKKTLNWRNKKNNLLKNKPLDVQTRLNLYRWPCILHNEKWSCRNRKTWTQRHVLFSICSVCQLAPVIEAIAGIGSWQNIRDKRYRPHYTQPTKHDASSVLSEQCTESSCCANFRRRNVINTVVNIDVIKQPQFQSTNVAYKIFIFIFVVL